MHTAAKSSLILTDFSSFKRTTDLQTLISYRGFYQLIAAGPLKGVQTRQEFCEIGNKLVVLAEEAHAWRRMELLEVVSQVLTSLPLPSQYQTVGRYYEAICLHKLGCGDIEKAARLFETVIENAPPRYRVRAMISRAAKPRRQGDYPTALSLYREAGRFISRDGLSDSNSTLQTHKMIAVINSLEGNHRGAFAVLENLFPLAQSMRLLQPSVYSDYLNSLAVELSEVGRFEEARNVSRIVLASPFASAYPEWRQTREEIELRSCRSSRDTVAFSQRRREAENLVQMPERDESLSVEPCPATEPASVVSLQAWKNKMLQQSDGDRQDSIIPRPGTDEEKQARLLVLEKLTERQKLLRIMEMLGDDGVTDKQLLRTLMILEDIEPKENQGS